MTGHLFQIITQHRLHLFNIAIHSSIILRETWIYGNELIICVGTSHYCVLIPGPSSDLQIDFSHFFYWYLLNLGFGAFGRLQVPQKSDFLLHKKNSHTSSCSVISNSRKQNHNVLRTHQLLFSCEKLLLKNCETKVILWLSLISAGVGCLLISAIVQTFLGLCPNQKGNQASSDEKSES